MKAKPILFSTEMVRALLAGRKTQTRRVIKYTDGILPDDCAECFDDDGWPLAYFEGSDTEDRLPCPYGQPGDLLWVRETWGTHQNSDKFSPSALATNTVIYYKATIDEQRQEQIDIDGHDPAVGKWRPSIHMPRWTSRLTLRIKDIRVERVQDISEDDAIEEGIEKIKHTAFGYRDYESDFNNTLQPWQSFSTLWDSINGKGDRNWQANPWVWVVEFEVIKKNVNEVLNKL